MTGIMVYRVVILCPVRPSVRLSVTY